MRHAQRVRVAQRIGQQRVGHVLIRHRPQEALDRARADRRRARVRRRRERSAVHHRVADLDARAEAVHEDAPGAALERRAQRGEQRRVALAEMRGDRQLAFERLQHAVQRVGIRAAHDERRGAEHFVAQLGVREQRVGRRREQCGARGEGPAGGAFAEPLDRAVRREPRDALAVARVDGRREHRLRGGGVDRGRRGLLERAQRWAVDRENQPRIRAELARAERERRDELLRDRVVPRGERAGHEHDRIDRAHLGVDGNRLGPRGGDAHQRDAAAPRAREADRLDARIGDERLADLARRVEQQREHARRQPAFAHRRLDRAADELGRAGMRAVRLDDHRAPGRERGRRVAARDRERERKIGRAEHGDGADRDIAQPQVDARQRLALRARGVDARVDEAAVAHDGREQRELPDGARALAFDPRARQPRFGRAALDQRVAERDDVPADRVEKRGACVEARLAVRVERVVGERARGVQVLQARAAERRLERRARGRLDRAERAVLSERRRLADQKLASESHGSPRRKCGPRVAARPLKKRMRPRRASVLVVVELQLRGRHAGMRAPVVDDERDGRDGERVVRVRELPGAAEAAEIRRDDHQRVERDQPRARAHLLGETQMRGGHPAAAREIDGEHRDLQPEQPRHGAPAGPVDDQRGDHERGGAGERERARAKRPRQPGRGAAQRGDRYRRDRVAQHERGRHGVDERLPRRERQRPEERQREREPQPRARNAGGLVDAREHLEERARLRPAVDDARRRVHVDVAAAGRRDHRVGDDHVREPADAERERDVAVRQRESLADVVPAAREHRARDAAEERELQQHIDQRREHDRQDQRDRNRALRVAHLARDRDDRREAEIREDDAARGHGHLDAGHAERREAVQGEVRGLEEREQHDDHRERHDELEHADDVVRLRERLHARIVQVEEETEQRRLHEPAERRRIARALDGQARKPRGRILARGDDFDRDQARERDQRDRAHQVAEQRAVREHRIADDAARARQRRAELAVDDAEQQHREAAEQPREDAGRARDHRYVARGEQPPRAEDRAEADERQIGERQLFLELAVAGVGGRGPRERRGSLGIALGGHGLVSLI
ncbi:amino acid permease domain protein [Burkholderia pseudomallei]|nr:amino acid permease domain protein [Burkholderia pseudomallei]